ncbi:hypothetical protein ENBRE01_2424 [Enteropsectra breve]|nr:hypothetical protein ENBRE01_2424 [Enteropsectra breve]
MSFILGDLYRILVGAGLCVLLIMLICALMLLVRLPSTIKNAYILVEPIDAIKNFLRENEFDPHKQKFTAALKIVAKMVEQNIPYYKLSWAEKRTILRAMRSTKRFSYEKRIGGAFYIYSQLAIENGTNPNSPVNIFLDETEEVHCPSTNKTETVSTERALGSISLEEADVDADNSVHLCFTQAKSTKNCKLCNNAMCRCILKTETTKIPDICLLYIKPKVEIKQELKLKTTYKFFSENGYPLSNKIYKVRAAYNMGPSFWRSGNFKRTLPPQDGPLKINFKKGYETFVLLEKTNNGGMPIYF